MMASHDFIAWLTLAGTMLVLVISHWCSRA